MFSKMKMKKIELEQFQLSKNSKKTMDLTYTRDWKQIRIGMQEYWKLDLKWNKTWLTIAKGH